MEASNNVYSKKVKAGKRTYFVDVKETRGGGYYLIVSESRRSFDENNTPSFQKSKLFVYPEDISRFTQTINDAFAHLKELMPNHDFEKFERRDNQEE